MFKHPCVYMSMSMFLYVGHCMHVCCTCVYANDQSGCIFVGYMRCMLLCAYHVCMFLCGTCPYVQYNVLLYMHVCRSLHVCNGPEIKHLQDDVHSISIPLSLSQTWSYRPPQIGPKAMGRIQEMCKYKCKDVSTSLSGLSLTPHSLLNHSGSLNSAVFSGHK